MKENLEDFNSPLFLSCRALFCVGNRRVVELYNYQLIKCQIALKTLKNSLKLGDYIAKYDIL